MEAPRIAAVGDCTAGSAKGGAAPPPAVVTVESASSSGAVVMPAREPQGTFEVRQLAGLWHGMHPCTRSLGCRFCLLLHGWFIPQLAAWRGWLHGSLALPALRNVMVGPLRCLLSGGGHVALLEACL